MIQTCHILEALAKNDVEQAKMLIRAEPVNAQNAFGVCALHLAVKKGLYEVVKLLLMQGADPNIRNEYDEVQSSPLSQEALPLFEGISSAMKEIIQDLQALAERTALHIAAKNSLVDIAALLIKYGADVDAKDFGGCTALHWAAINGDLPFIKLLLESGAAINVQDLADSTPLHETLRHGQSEALKFLLEKGADPELVDALGMSSLKLAESKPELLHMLLMYASKVPQDVVRH